MSDTVVRKKKRDRFLGALPFRSSSRPSSSQSLSSQPSSQLSAQEPRPSSQPSASQPPATYPTTATTVPPQPPIVTNRPAGQAVGGASSAKDFAFLENVLGRLTEEQRSTLDSSYAQSSSDIGSTLTAALQAAENKKQLCISKQWTLKIGSRTISTREKAEKVVELLEKFKRVGDIVASADPIHAGLPWAGVSLILQVAASEKQQTDAMLSGIATALSMQRTLDIYLAFFHTLPHSDPATALGTALVETYATVLGFLATSIGLLTKGSASRFWAALLGGGELQQFGSTCLAAGHQVEVAASNCDRSLDARGKAITLECKGILDLLLGDIDAIKHQTARIELSISLAKLPRASTAAFDSTDEERMPRCLKSTRVELLSDIERWVQDPASAQFFWLQGVAGTGKSTVARTIANILHDHQILGASFFFKRGHAERGSADLFFATIAIQLAQKIPGMDGAIAQLLENEIGVYMKGIHTQFRDLVLDPLQATCQVRQATHLELVILIDALDECDDEGDRKGDIKQILDCLAQLKGVDGLRLRLIVTSRLEFPVEVGFAALGGDAHDDILLHELPLNEIERDIRIFIEAEFEVLRHTLFQRRRREILHDGWPGDNVVQVLTKRSVPLFIFASTVCSFVADGRFTPQDQLKKVLEDRNPVQLSSTYLLVLQAMVPEFNNGIDEDWYALAMDNFRKIVGLIIFSTEPPSIITIARLLELTTDQVEATLDNLHSVLDVTTDLDRPVRPFHLSFIEYLARPRAAHRFQIDESTTHGFIARKCLAFMMQPGRLQQDICEVRKPGSRRQDVEPHVIESHISPTLSYACRYWVHHFEAGSVVADDQHETLKFFSGWFPYWYEAMGWLGKATEVPRIIKRFKTLIKVGVEVLAEAYEFSRHNEYIVDLAPLQVYTSALAFHPNHSIIKKLFKPCMHSWMLNPPKVEESWRSGTLKFEGHTRRISAITFSPDDKFLGTCSIDGTARVWDTTDASCSLTVSLDRPDHYPDAIAFSSNSSKLAVAYRPWKMESNMEIAVAVYNMSTGNLVRTMQCSELLNKTMCLAVAFDDGDQDHNTIVSAVADTSQVQVWRSVNDSNNLTGAWTSHFPTQGQKEPIRICISQDASLLCCSGVLDENGPPGMSSISILDPRTGVVICRFDPGQNISLVNISGTAPVYRKKGYGAWAQSLRSFDVDDPSESTHLFDYAGIWDCISLPNGKDRVAFSTTSDYTVYVEAIAENRTVGKWMQRLNRWRQVAVAPKGDLVADWNGGRLTFLDTRGLVTKQMMAYVDEGKICRIARCLAISLDRQYVALGHEDGVTVWNIETGERWQNIANEYPQELAFSHDNRLLACASRFSLRVWDLESKRMLLSTDLFFIGRIEFSPDGRDLVTDDGRLHLATATWTPQRRTEPWFFSKEINLSHYSMLPEWVRFDDENIFWIPEDCRANHNLGDAGGGTVALGQEDGSVMILTFPVPSVV